MYLITMILKDDDLVALNKRITKDSRKQNTTGHVRNTIKY